MQAGRVSRRPVTIAPSCGRTAKKEPPHRTTPPGPHPMRVCPEFTTLQLPVRGGGGWGGWGGGGGVPSYAHAYFFREEPSEMATAPDPRIYGSCELIIHVTEHI